MTSEIYQFATTGTNSPETHITHFTAYKLNSNQKKTLTLAWSSAQSSEGEYFEIQKRYEEGEWEFVTVIESSSDNKYSRNINPEKDGTLALRVIKYEEDGYILFEVETNANITFTDYMLMQNYPNPFNPLTNIDFILVTDSRVVMKLYNITGELIKTLINDNLSSGVHSYELKGNELSSGIYFYSFEAVSSDGMHQHNSVRKLILLK